ncbi:hypothetical protein VW29_15935 [Devosia limi DSM 17137]|uniref:CAF17 C-terminal domain-containing protein n=1 Tax=Devosia limi DSM 17137 TaxID=1121477 RepID=A0A0F5LJR6_9HYPH|nr:hypothetical protein [Devosia limi]KKB82646.1 hypothetical protein VW29_15935 [Devosia limi DSM 17137]SHE46723.1 hypothetical protein SAMN02745223_00462 [Devosia limi DSM 17137]
MSIHLRADRVVFRFSGPEAHKLLNDVVTGPIPNSGEMAAWWALLSPQGKILAEGLAGWADDAVWLDVHESVADDFYRRMRMYRLRASVMIDDLRATHRVGWSREKPNAGLIHGDRIGPVDLGWRVIAPLEETSSWVQDDTEYARIRIAAGIAQLGQDFAADTTFAHDIGMDMLDGIDFVKGCYVGQEVVSRMKHRGTARRRPVVVTGIMAPTGTAILANGRDSGTIGRVVDGSAVGIVRLDRFPADGTGTIAGSEASLSLPAWATYAFGESGGDE